MTVLPNMSLTLPTRGPSGAGLWGDTEDANLNKLDIHDHSSGKGARITPAGLNINADLPFSALYAPTQLHRLQFSAIAGAGLTAGQRKSLFVSDGTGGLVANELYYFTSAGASIQITSGSNLNVGTFSGTIGGDYGAVGAQLNYTDSSKTYDFKESTTDSHAWARVQCGGIRLIEFNTTESFFVAQIAPAALGASYTMTWPTALPGSTVLGQIDNAGQHIWSNTIVNDLTMTATKNIILSSTSVVKHGTYTISLAAADMTGLLGTTITLPSGNIIAQMSGATAAMGASVNLPVGKRILAIRYYIADNVTGPTKVAAAFSSTALTTGVETDIVIGGASAGTGAQQTLTNGGLTTVITAGTAYTVWIKTTTGSAAVTLNGIEIDYDHP